MRLAVSYNLRSLFVRRAATLLTIVGIGATVAVLAGVLSLRQGFETLFADAGRTDVGVFLRPGATNEGDSVSRRGKAQRLLKTRPEIAEHGNGMPLAGMECYLAVRRFRVDGGETNVPLRGVEPATFAIRGEGIRVIEGRPFERGADEVIVGSKLVGYIRNCELGATIKINTTPLKVVGVFESDGPFTSEIWGDLDRMLGALNRPSPNRVLARMRPGTDMDALAMRLENDKETPAKAMTERAYLTSQTAALSGILLFLALFLAAIMGTAAVFTATNTMLSAISARTHEIGVLLALGFPPWKVFVGFLSEAVLLGLLGGAVGCLLALPLNGIETGATNFNTFTEVAFAFRVGPGVLGTAAAFAFVLGLLGGTIPAWKASRLPPVTALRAR